LNINFESGKETLNYITITDATGRIVSNQSYQTKVGKNYLEINLENLEKGYYILSVLDNELFRTVKFIKE